MESACVASLQTPFQNSFHRILYSSRTLPNALFNNYFIHLSTGTCLIHCEAYHINSLRATKLTSHCRILGVFCSLFDAETQEGTSSFCMIKFELVCAFLAKVNNL